MTDSSSDSLRLRLVVPDVVPAGEPVAVTLRVDNVTDRTLTLYLTGREIAFDVRVETLDGEAVWRRLEGEIVQSILRLEMLPPGGALVLEHVWDQRSNAGEPVAPAAYLVSAELLTEGAPLVPPARPLRIVAG